MMCMARPNGTALHGECMCVFGIDFDVDIIEFTEIFTGSFNRDRGNGTTVGGHLRI